MSLVTTPKHGPAPLSWRRCSSMPSRLACVSTHALTSNCGEGGRTRQHASGTATGSRRQRLRVCAPRIPSVQLDVKFFSAEPSHGDRKEQLIVISGKAGARISAPPMKSANMFSWDRAPRKSNIYDLGETSSTRWTGGGAGALTCEGTGWDDWVGVRGTSTRWADCCPCQARLRQG